MSRIGINGDFFGEGGDLYKGGKSAPWIGSDYTTGGFKAIGPRCYESHPPIEFGPGKFHGGSCIYPVVKNADIYIGLDDAMSRMSHEFPWEDKKAGPIEVFFPIRDRSVPKKDDIGHFKKMVTWTLAQMAEGKTVHAGCMGGHGRTGLLLSALIAEFSQEEDAITWVRKNYCKKAVESVSQVDFLVKHYKVKAVNATDASYHPKPAPSSSKGLTAAEFYERFPTHSLNKKLTTSPPTDLIVSPSEVGAAKKNSIWNRKIISKIL